MFRLNTQQCKSSRECYWLSFWTELLYFLAQTSLMKRAAMNTLKLKNYLMYLHSGGNLRNSVHVMCFLFSLFFHWWLKGPSIFGFHVTKFTVKLTVSCRYMNPICLFLKPCQWLSIISYCFVLLYLHHTCNVEIRACAVINNVWVGQYLMCDKKCFIDSRCGEMSQSGYIMWSKQAYQSKCSASFLSFPLKSLNLRLDEYME